METKEDRQVKSAYGTLGRAMVKKYASPEQQQQDKLFSTDIQARQRMEAAIRGAPDDVYVAGSIERFKGSQLTPNEVAQKTQAIIDAYSEWYREDQKRKQQQNLEAQRKQALQETPYYQIQLGATFGIFGTYYGSTGPSKDGLKYAELLKTYDTATIKDAIRRLKNKELAGYPLASYSPDYIQQVIDYLVAEVISREPEQAPTTVNQEKSAIEKLKAVVSLFRGY